MKEHLADPKRTYLSIKTGHRDGSIDDNLMGHAVRMLERLPGQKVVRIHAKHRWQKHIRGALKAGRERNSMDVVTLCYCPLWERFTCEGKC